MAWTATGGGDHEGEDWTPADALVISGIHYNIGTFLVTNGYTIHLTANEETEIYSNVCTITGTINGNSKGSLASSGTGQGTDAVTNYYGGGGAGYGGAGGLGSGPVSGGSAFGTTNTTIISMGSGGGNGGAGRLGGVGGGSIYISANTVTVTGTINCNGAAGQNADAGTGGGGGGGSGGGILLVGGAITVSGTITCIGGAGGNGYVPQIWEAGGGGGGGRIKIIYRTINIAGATFTMTGGAAGTVYGTEMTAGTVGVHTDTIIKCTSALTMGQTFTLDDTNTVYLSYIKLWAMTVTTGAEYTLTVYDTPAKGSTYGSAVLSITTTGEKIFIFDELVPVLATKGFMELTTSSGDVAWGIYFNEPIADEDAYFNSVLVERSALYIILSGYETIDSPVVYNTANTTVKCVVANGMLPGAIHRINSDGTGAIDWDIDFSDNTFLISSVSSGITYDGDNSELDLADDGYIYWLIDTKYPINGTPTLLSQINITAGTPTIQISTNASDWYDIDTAIVDDVETSYPLDNAASLSLAGKTSFYFRFDCVKAGAATCSVKSFELDVDIHTIYAKNPKIAKGGAANTFRCDQDSDSGMACQISLIYPHRWWA